MPDGSGWLSVNNTPERSELLNISRDGKSRTLWTSEEVTLLAAIPSRDGKHLAIEATTTMGNVWMMTGFQK
jgi:hypothetical protein